MGRAFHDASPAARAVFDAAESALGFPLRRVCFEGPETELALTATTQPAILTCSLAALAALREAAPEWDRSAACAAGHSLGEYTALVAAGALKLEDAARIVRRRGEYMQDAVPVGQGAMAALLGTPLAVVEGLCREAAQGEVLSPANLNAPDQTVVAGTAAAVARLETAARAAGVRKVVRLPVSAPFHCALMEPAARRLAADLERLALRDAVFPVVLNTTGRPETRAAAFRDALLKQVTAPVRWVESVQRFGELGARRAVEIGPGRVLTGLVRRIAPELAPAPIEDPAGLAAALQSLGAEGMTA